MKQDDYSPLLFFIGLWLMVLACAQCETNKTLEDIRYEISNLRYK